MNVGLPDVHVVVMRVCYGVDFDVQCWITCCTCCGDACLLWAGFDGEDCGICPNGRPGTLGEAGNPGLAGKGHSLLGWYLPPSFLL